MSEWSSDTFPIHGGQFGGPAGLSVLMGVNAKKCPRHQCFYGPGRWPSIIPSHMWRGPRGSSVAACGTTRSSWPSWFIHPTSPHPPVDDTLDVRQLSVRRHSCQSKVTTMRRVRELQPQHVILHSRRVKTHSGMCLRRTGWSGMAGRVSELLGKVWRCRDESGCFKYGSRFGFWPGFVTFQDGNKKIILELIFLWPFLHNTFNLKT